MIFRGIQKVTLLDYPEHIACTLFTGGCNFRCPFCHNSSLVFDKNPARISEEEVLEFLKKRRNCRQGVCITGGVNLRYTWICQILSQKLKLLATM